MKQTTKRFASIVIGLALLAATFISYFEFIQPAYDDAQSAKAAYISEQQFLDTEQSTVKKVQDLISSYENQAQVQQAVSSALPVQEDVVGAIAQLYGLASQSGLSLQSISVSVTGIQNASAVKPAAATASGALPSAANFQASLQKPVGSISIQVKLDGQYENLKQFISLLGTNIRIFDVKTLGIQSHTLSQGVGQTKTVQQTYNFDVNVMAYYQSP